MENFPNIYIKAIDIFIYYIAEEKNLEILNIGSGWNLC